MATRMQQRRGTSSEWTSTNDGDGPILNAGEIGYETNTGKFKIGDGSSYWADLNYFLDAVDLGGNITDYVPLTQKSAASGVAALDVDKNLVVPGASIIVEGATDNSFETTLTVTNPTADQTITFPDATGTVQLRVSNVDDTEIGYLNGVTSGIQTQMDLKAPLASPTFTGTVTIPAGASISGFAPLDNPALTGTATAVNLTISGDLTVNGTTTNINSTSLVVEDKNIVLADVASPTDITADGGGITLKGATDKTFNWVDSTDAWTSSEHINLASNKTLKYNGTDLVAAQSGNSGKFLTTDGTSTSWATVSGYSAPTLGSTSIASGATVTTIVGLTKVRSDQFTTLDADGYEVDLEAMQIMGAL
jgi:hypothetical protein